MLEVRVQSPALPPTLERKSKGTQQSKFTVTVTLAPLQMVSFVLPVSAAVKTASQHGAHSGGLHLLAGVFTLLSKLMLTKQGQPPGPQSVSSRAALALAPFLTPSCCVSGRHLFHWCDRSP